MDRRSLATCARQAQVAIGELRSKIDGSGGGGGVAYEARGYKQGWADGPNQAWLVHFSRRQ